MSKYIDAEKLIGYIKNLNKVFETCAAADVSRKDFFEGKREMGVQVISLINSLQQEQPEVDLEKETRQWWKEHLHLSPENQLWMDAHQSVVFARHFYELGLNARKEE